MYISRLLVLVHLLCKVSPFSPDPMNLPIYNTNHDNPPGPLVTMDPTSYIPTATNPMVPLPLGLQISTLESSIDTTHPITLSYCLDEVDFPQSDTGTIHHHAFTHVSEFFSHGFNPIEDNTPEREMWITAATQVLVDIHNSICHTNLTTPLLTSFNDLTIEEFGNLQLLKRTVTLLSPIFLFLGLPPLLHHPHYLTIALTTLCLLLYIYKA